MSGRGPNTWAKVRNQFWCDRSGEVEDPFGFVWAFATHLEDLTADEIEARRQKMFGGGKPGPAYASGAGKTTSPK